jgi:beta-glucuronidase
MLRPKATPTRELVCLDGLWNFAILSHPPPDLPSSTTTVTTSSTTNNSNTTTSTTGRDPNTSTTITTPSWTSPLPASSPLLPVPSSYNDILLHPSLRNHVGWVLYQRRIRIPRGFGGQRILLRIEAATHHGRVFVNDQLVAEHRGGYTPFDADLTGLVQPGEEARVGIAVGNELTKVSFAMNWPWRRRITLCEFVADFGAQ